MIAYALRRLLGAIPTLLMLITLAFFMIRLSPGGPFDNERTLPPEIEANLNARYHLDEPLAMQYARYLGNVLRFDFGPSFQYKDWTVNELISSGFPVSATLGLLAMALALVVGLSAGTYAALRQNSWIDYGVMTIAMTGISIPTFVVAPLLILVVALSLGWLPAGGWDWTPARMVMPVVTLALPLIAYISRLMRASLIEVLHSNFIRTARAKGLSERQVIFRHALKPAALPVISFLGPAIASVLTGSVVVERIFTVPGLGSHFVQGALNRDYTLVLGVVVFYGMLIIVLNFLVDLIYAWLDPRIRYDRRWS
ncbi:MAG: oligopeptide ABC transporter permease OppB [Xanthomonadales bacterium]|jgi:oligopeptide transport system permease protein|nr:oligopeptide ABC transporter permease OppB [Xanthomonadales bacterium]